MRYVSVAFSLRQQAGKILGDPFAVGLLQSEPKMVDEFVPYALGSPRAASVQISVILRGDAALTGVSIGNWAHC